jgi:hypothetical protein
MFRSVESRLAAVPPILAGLRSRAEALNGLLKALVCIVRQLRSLVAQALRRGRLKPPTRSYETLWLELVLDLEDVQGNRAVLSRCQRVRFLVPDGAVVRELVWGEGEQLVRYSARGARRVGVRPEGSKRAVLLDPDQRPAPGDQLTITSRRTIHGGFRQSNEFCEALLERPTGRLDFTVVFPLRRPPREACLVLAPTEQVLRTLRPRYGPDGRAVLRCRLQKPAVGVTYSLRWAW